jgi:hypothetical protein
LAVFGELVLGLEVIGEHSDLQSIFIEVFTVSSLYAGISR